MAFDRAYLIRILAESERIREIIAATHLTIARSEKLLSESQPNSFLGSKDTKTNLNGQEPCRIASMERLERECHRQAHLTSHEQARQELEKMEREYRAIADWLERRQQVGEKPLGVPANQPDRTRVAVDGPR